jgi:hypothetical protein
MVAAGANRIGASASVRIIQETAQQLAAPPASRAAGTGETENT